MVTIYDQFAPITSLFLIGVIWRCIYFNGFLQTIILPQKYISIYCCYMNMKLATREYESVILIVQHLCETLID